MRWKKALYFQIVGNSPREDSDLITELAIYGEGPRTLIGEERKTVAFSDFSGPAPAFTKVGISIWLCRAPKTNKP